MIAHFVWLLRDVEVMGVVGRWLGSTLAHAV